MFRINQSDMPLLRTGAAVLILDVQNDIVAPDGILKVDQPSDFMSNIHNLVPVFRSWGQIIWIGTQFERHRAINDGSLDAESVITDEQLPTVGREMKQRNRMSTLLHRVRSRRRHCDEEDSSDEIDFQNLDMDEEAEEEEEEEEASETFLTLGVDQASKCCLPMSLGVNLISSVLQGAHSGVDSRTDLVIGKTHYSAFKSGALIQKLRSNMITELFICGALTNISVYATVLDAVRHGYNITIITDCCGYKSHARHGEAMRQMTESMGCETKSSIEIIADIKAKERRREKAFAHIERRERSRQQQQDDKGNNKKVVNESELDDLMGKLELRDGEGHKGRHAAPPPFRPQPDTNIRSHLWTVATFSPPTPSAVSPKPPANKTRVKSNVSVRRRSSSKSKKKEERPAVTRLTAEKPSLCATLPQVNGEQEPPPTDNPIDTQNMPNLEKLSLGDHTSSTYEKKSLMPSTTEKNETEAKVGSAFEPNVSAAFCEGDSNMIYNLFPDSLADHLFQKLCCEVVWQRMSHQGGDAPRLVAVRGLVSPDGTFPFYRHPSDESPPLSPFSETVRQIIPYVESVLGHTVNHVLIQLYRNGTDHITEHSDKTLDIVPNTYIANVSLGAQRTMTFRTKKPVTSLDQNTPKESQSPKTSTTTNSTGLEGSSESTSVAKKKSPAAEISPRTVHKEALPHNSMCKFGWKSNAIWLHGIRPDKRLESEKAPEILAFNGSRISLTFRKIGTFLNHDQTLIWGQGAIAKDEKNAGKVVCGETEATKQMLIAFGRENKLGAEFVWEKEYGVGFDVLHVKNDRKLVLGGNQVEDLRVRTLLSELKIEAEILGEEGLTRLIRLDGDGKEILGNEREKKTTFVDNDPKRSRVEGDVAILLYLDRVYGNNDFTSGANFCMGKCFSRLLQANKPLKSLQKELSLWESFILEHGNDGYVAGTGISLVDYVFWPVLHCLSGKFEESKVLKGYYQRFGQRSI